MCCVILILKNCQSTDKKDDYCQNNCIKPKSSVITQIKNVIIEVRTNEKDDEEIYPPSKGFLMVIDNHLFGKKKKCKREKDVFVTPDYPSATTVYIPKEKNGWQCFSFRINEIVSIRHSIFDSILGVYLISIDGNDNQYLIRVGKGGRLSLSKKLDMFIKNLQDISGKDCEESKDKKSRK